MQYPAVPRTPSGYHLAYAILATYDLALPVLRELLDGVPAARCCIVYGDGAFEDLPAEDPARQLWHSRILRAAFPEENGSPSAYVHGKFWLFEYQRDQGKGPDRCWHLSIHSTNISAFDNLETGVQLCGVPSGESTPQKQAEALRSYLLQLDALAESAPGSTGLQADAPESAQQMLRLMADRLQSIRFTPVHAQTGDVSFTPDPAIRDDQWELLALGCPVPGSQGAVRTGDFLLQPCDALLIIAPFLRRSMLRQIASAACSSRTEPPGRCIVLTHPASLQEFLLQGDESDVRDMMNEVPGLRFLVPPETEADRAETFDGRYMHAKVYLRRRDDRWEILCGSMNPSDFSMHRNLELMVRLPLSVADAAAIGSPESASTDHTGTLFIERFLAKALSVPTEQIRGMLLTEAGFVPGDSPVFREAASQGMRLQYLRHQLTREKHSNHEIRLTLQYLLSERCVPDLVGLLHGEREIAIPIRQIVLIPAKNKERELYLLPREDRILLGLLNHVMHRFDDRFSPDLCSHILGQTSRHALVRVHEKEDFDQLYLFKTDVAGYDYTMDADILSEAFRSFLPEDPSMCAFLDRIIHRRLYQEDGKILSGGPAVLTGSALAGLSENVYLRDFDEQMGRQAAFYVRCADDILIGARSRSELDALIEEAHAHMDQKKLALHPTKSRIIEPGESFSYLGWQITGNDIDFTPETMAAIRSRIRRETMRALRQYDQNDVDPFFRMPRAIQRAELLVQSMELRNTFKTVTVPDGYRQIDRLLCDMIRTVITGRKGKARYRISTDDIRRWGYRSLVGEYYRHIDRNRRRKAQDDSTEDGC